MAPNSAQGVKHEPIVRKLRPTLFVALGGTGKEIVLRLRRRILQGEWGGVRINDLSRFPIASFLYFDTDTTEAMESDRSQGADPLARAVAFTEREKLQRRVDVRRYMNELDAYPLVRSWLPKGELQAIDTEKGAGQVRAISRLLFFDAFREFKSLAAAQGAAVLNSVGRQHDLAHLRLDLEPELRIVVVASAAGGTGAGSFIDVGLALRSMRNPKPAQVDLMLLLPGGFRGANEQRVSANAFASLMELEHVMRPNSFPPYVSRWTDSDGPEDNLTPYNDVYLLDTRNVMGAGTEGKVENIYDMVADVLFEDFGSSDFASKKRSVSVNQAQHKLGSYFPKMSDAVGSRSLSYSIAFSSFGQATIDTKGQAALDTAIADACRNIIKVFFNVAVTDSGKLPTPEEINNFLSKYLSLSNSSFEEVLDGFDDNSAINEPELVQRLLGLHGSDSVIESLKNEIHHRFDQDVLGSGDIANWVELVMRAMTRAHDDVVGTIETQGAVGVSGAQIIENREKLANLLKGDGTSGVRSALYAFLDNHERGGLDYAIKLVEESKLRMKEECERLLATKQLYEARAAQVREQFNQSMENLREAARDRLIFGPRREDAEKYVGHLRDETCFYVSLLLRAVACEQAYQLVSDISDDLGKPTGRGRDGETTYSGAMAELLGGRELVNATMNSFEREIALLQDAVSRQESGTYIVLPDTDKEAEKVLQIAPEDIEKWARELFKDDGGSRALFPVLADDAKRSALLNRLRQDVRTKFAPRAAKLRSVDEVLLSMSPESRADIFRRAMVRAMPWINADFDRVRDSLIMKDRYKLFIAVSNREVFEGGVMENEIRQAVPSGRLAFTEFGFVKTDLRNRIIFYCELSGLPLDSIIPLRDNWRAHYRDEKQNGQLPLHNHRNATRFANPVVPSSDDIKRIRETMSLFLRGVCFGLLERNPGPDAAYTIKLGDGDVLEVGSERDIRADGFLSSVHKRELEDSVARFESRLKPIQLLAAAALLEWTGKRAYASRKVQTTETVSERIPGLVQMVAIEVAGNYDKRFKSIPASGGIADPVTTRQALRDSVPQWTTQIPESVADTDPSDTNRDASEADSLRAEDKRTIVLDLFEPESLEEMVRVTTRKPSVATAPKPPTPPVQAPSPSGRMFKQWSKPEGAAKGIQLGPFSASVILDKIATGEVLAGTKLWPMDQQAWIEAEKVSEFAELFSSIPDPEDEIPDPE
jgi:hypothetical protein